MRQSKLTRGLKANAERIANELPERLLKGDKARHKSTTTRRRQTGLVAEINSRAEQSYNQLDGEWLDWLEVARKYEHKVPSQDRYDIRHSIILELAKARRRDGEPIPPLRAYRIASLVVALYWRRIMRQPTLLSLNTEIDDDATELSETIADDHAIDLDLQIDASTWLLGCPLRLVQIANKRVRGKPLDKNDQKYLERYRRKTQISLF